MHEITVTSSGRGSRPISGSGYQIESLAVGPIVNEFYTLQSIYGVHDGIRTHAYRNHNPRS
jgi:hypothetical protein